MDNTPNEKKCSGYESKFTFLNDDDFKKHLEECEECRLEHLRMQRVTELIQEAKPYFNRNKSRKTFVKAACAAFVVFVMSGCYSMFTMSGFYDNMVASNQPSIEEMGLPVDEYGLLMVD